MKSHTINILKLCKHSGIANPSITDSVTLIKKQLKACVQYFSFFHQMIALKVELSTFTNNCVISFIESPLKMMQNAFFILRTLFVLKIFKFCLCLSFRSCRKRGLIRKIRLTARFMTSQLGQQTIAINMLPNIS